MLNFDACDLVEELRPGKHASDMVWVDEWRGDRVRSRLCVRQFKAGSGTTCLRDRQTHFGIFVIDFSVAFMHARTDDEIYVKVPSGIKSWNLMAAVNGTRKASKHWQEYSSDRLVTNMPFQQNDINPCIYKRFCDDLDLEQHGDDFLVCGATRCLDKLPEESNEHFLMKNFEIVSWHVELDQRMAINHCKTMATPGSKRQEGNSATEKRDAKEHREFRSGAGICQYMTEQRFDIAFSTKEIMREAAGPTTASKTKLKRIARYFKGRQRCV